jgi:hypothetical protein
VTVTTPDVQLAMTRIDELLAAQIAAGGTPGVSVAIALADGWFRLGEDEGIPEGIRFDLPIDGLTRRAWLGVWPWFRVAD